MADVALQAYLTSTLAPTNTPNVLIVETTPIPTSTPYIYIVQKGDTFSEIAESFNISIADLRAANPDISPNTMSIGETLIIPDPSAILTVASTPTPLPVLITQTICHPDLSAGTHCFALLQNNTNQILENISVKLNLFDAENASIASETAFTVLDIIPANSSLPAYVYFPDVNQAVNPQVQLLSAVQGNPDNYLPAVIQNSITEITGNYAQVRGKIYLPAEAQAATQVWIAAVAYDKNTNIVGMRRWEGGDIQPGGRINFQFGVSSLGQDIETVELFFQAKP